MKLEKEEQILEHEYHVSWYIIAYKFIFGLTEFLAGSSVAIFGRELLKYYTVSVAKELSQDPHDLLANISEKIVPGLLSHNLIIAIYLVLLGGVKMVGATGLIFKKNWGVDLLVGLTLILLPFQIIDLVLNFSIFALIYLLVGLFIAMYLIEFKPKSWISRRIEKLFLLFKR